MDERKMQLRSCQECDFKATRIDQVKSHVLRIHRMQFDFKCSHCPKQYTTKSELKFHINSSHKKKTLKCPHCNKAYSVEKYLKFHLKQNHGPESAKKEHNARKNDCSHCDFKSVSPIILRNHIKFIYKDGFRDELICDECGHQEFNWEDFRKHLKTNHYEIYGQKVLIKTYKNETKCPLCDSTFGYKMDMKRHVKAVHEGIKYNCDQCEFHSGYTNLLRSHIKRVHELYRHKCNLCDELFTHSDHLRDHIRVIHEGLHYLCQICNRPHTRKKDLARHLVCDHTVSTLLNMDKIQEFNCDSCHFKTTSKRLMKTHLIKFHKELFYECGHKKVPGTGKEEEKLVCPDCSKMFAQQANVQSYGMVKHQDTFPCPFCDFETSQRTNLQTHISDHHVEKTDEKKMNLK